MPVYTVSQVAKYLDTSGTTIRNYAAEFAEFLSPTATPPAGEPRQFSDDDLAVLSTVFVMRGQLATPAAIVAALRDGQRLEPARAAGPDDAPAVDAPAAFTTALQVLESRLNKLEDRLEIERDARIDAEKRATAAETELKVLRELYEEEQATTTRPISFREWWQRRRRG